MDQTDQDSALEREWKPVSAAHVLPLVLDTDDVGHDDSAQHLSEFRGTHEGSRMEGRIGVTKKRQPVPKASLSFSSKEGSFIDVFGAFGVLMATIFVVSALWTFMLACIQLYPTEMANAIMNTSKLDNGDFWVLPQPSAAFVGTSVFLLVLFGLGYFGIVIFMVFFRRIGGAHHGHNSADASQGKANSAANASGPTNTQERSWRNGVQWLQLEVLAPHGCYHQLFSALLDFPKLIFQTTTLLTYLRNGFPTPLIYFYSSFLLVNWIVGFARYRHRDADPNFVIARLFYTFDMFFAVFAPLVVLVYFITHFQFDRAAFQTRVETLQYGSFDRTARLFGNPAQIASFCNAFHYLQFSDSGSLFTKSALNLLSLYKGKKIVLGLIGRHRAWQLQPAQCQQPPLCTANSSLPVAPSGAVTEIRSIVKKYVGSKRRAAGFLSAFTFVLAGGGIFTYSLVAVHSSEELCRPYTQCAVFSYQWNVGATHCTCLVFVDRDIAPATYAEWVSPDDTTANLAELAVAGELRIIQIINRAVPVLPQELRRCHKLEQFILVYSKIVRLPDWIKEFNKLQYLHLEGDFTDQQIEYMPPDMFANMPDLAFMHLGCIPKVPLIPSLAKLRALRYLTMAVLHSLSSLPDLDGLTSLQTLNIVDATHIPRLPSFAALSKLKSIALINRNQVCCDGYVTGQCNLMDFQCIPRVGEPVITCSSERLATSELEHLTAIGATLCQSKQTTDLKDMAPTQVSTDELCGGVRYKQCELDGSAGICFNSRMQVISCVVQAGVINMRKLQIARGVADPCKPEVEAWLGCT